MVLLHLGEFGYEDLSVGSLVDDVIDDVQLLSLLQTGVFPVLRVHYQPELSEVRDGISRVQVALDDYLVLVSLLEVGEDEELLKQRVEDSVQIETLGEPRPAGKTERRVTALQKADHHVQNVVLLATELLSKGLIECLTSSLVRSVLPELGKLLDSLILNLDISVLKFVDNDS